MFSKTSLVVIVLVVIAATAVATGQVATGTPAFGSFGGGPFDIVNYSFDNLQRGHSGQCLHVGWFGTHYLQPEGSGFRHKLRYR